MSQATTRYLDDVDACVDAILERIGPRIVFGSPIALGKPNHLINALVIKFFIGLPFMQQAPLPGG